jgi:2-dehydro-3-deoxyphosphooctonate aldolase (KDO 8-P synthase)
MSNLNNKMMLFSGPCVLESEELAFEIAGFLKESLTPFSDRLDLTFKGSFDKANRSSVDSYRGPGIEKGLAILAKVKKELSLPVITDFHLPEQAEEVASVVDTLQIPAFLCRQTDLIVAGAKACAKYDRQLKIKKGQFLSPEETSNIVHKVENFLPKEKIILTERGSSFGYNNLVVDMASFMIMKSFGVRTVHDATHCVQKPGGLGDKTGGKREQIEVLAKAALAAGADGLFMECHPNPTKALSDATTCLELSKMPVMIEKLLRIYEVSRD